MMSKGSARRPENHNCFSQNFDQIFGKKDKQKITPLQQSDCKNLQKHITELSQTLDQVKTHS